MDEETRQQFAALMARMNDGFEHLLDRISSLDTDVRSLRQDFQNTKEFLVGDALVSSRRWLDLETRVNRLEQKGKE